MSIRTRMKAHMRTMDIHANISIVDRAKHVSEYGATPNAAVTAPLGALCIDTATSDIYINTDGASAWSKFCD
jgi:hypothetical protein